MSRLAGRGNLVRLAHKTVAEQQLVDYIKKAKSANQQDAQTRTLLAKNGWTEAEINDAFAAVNPPQTVSQPPIESKPQGYSQPQQQQQPQQPKTDTQISGQPKIDVRPQPAVQPQTAVRPQVQAQTQVKPQYSPVQPQSNMSGIKQRSHLLAKVLITLIVVLVLMGVGIYSADKFFNVSVLSYITSMFSTKVVEQNPQIAINGMLEKMKTVTSSSVVAQVQVSLKTGDVTQGSASINITGGNDVTDINNPKSESSISFSSSPSGSATPTTTASLNLITIGDVAYIKLNNIVLPADNSLMLGSDISQLQNKFFKIDQESSNVLSETDIGSSQIPVIDAQTRLDLGKNIRDLFLTGDSMTFKAKLSDEKVGGNDTYHYLLTIKKEKIQELLNQIMDTQATQSAEPGTQSNETQTALESAVDAIGAVDVEVWIGKSDNFLYRVKTNKTLDIGKIMPILNLQVNIVLDATYSNYNKALNIQEPQDAQKIEDVILPMITAQKIVSGLNQVGSEADSLFFDNQSYALLCKNGFLNGSKVTPYGQTFVIVANSLIKLGAKNPICFASSQNYCVSTQLSDGYFMCIDKNGLGNVKCTSAQTSCSAFTGLPE